MKIIIEHDKRGNIRSVATVSTQGAGTSQATLRPRPGHQISEVEAPHIKDAQDHKALAGIRGQFRVEVRTGPAKLIPKKR